MTGFEKTEVMSLLFSKKKALKKSNVAYLNKHSINTNYLAVLNFYRLIIPIIFLPCQCYVSTFFCSIVLFLLYFILYVTANVLIGGR